MKEASGKQTRASRRKSDRRALSRSEKGGNRAASIGGNPSGRVSRFAEREILPVSSLHRPALQEWPSLSPVALPTHTRQIGQVWVRIESFTCTSSCASVSSSFLCLSFTHPPSLIAPYPPPRAERGIRALIRANYTGGSQFNFARKRVSRGTEKHDISIVDPT